MKKIAVGLFVFAALSLVAVTAFLLPSCGRNPAALKITALTEPLRSKPMTSYERHAVARELESVLAQLAGSSSQRDYDEYVPLACERAVKLMWHRLREDWGRDIDPGLARRPLLKILAGKDPHLLAPAELLAGYFNMQEATPLLIELVTTRFQGENWPDFKGQMTMMEAFRALAKLATHGDKRAADFLISHSKIDAWKEISYSVLKQNKSVSADYAWTRVCETLMYYPCEDSIKALQESGFEYSNNRIHTIREYLKSGDTLEEYYRELKKGTISNKYMVNFAFETETVPTNQGGVWTNAHLVVGAGRTEVIRILHGTNASVAGTAIAPHRSAQSPGSQ